LSNSGQAAPPLPSSQRGEFIERVAARLSRCVRFSAAGFDRAQKQQSSPKNEAISLRLRLDVEEGVVDIFQRCTSLQRIKHVLHQPDQQTESANRLCSGCHLLSPY
jgi:hypothetical protein